MTADSSEREQSIGPRQRAFFARFTTGARHIDIGPSASPHELTRKAEALEAPLMGSTPMAFVSAYFGRNPVCDMGEDWWKGDFDEAEHPRQPKGTPKGGEFADKDQAAADDVADNQINQGTILKDLARGTARRIARRELKDMLIAGLRGIAGIAADVVPGLGEVFDAYEAAQTVADFEETASEARAAIDYVEGGPRALDDLRVSQEDKNFPSADAFKKDGVEKFYGPAGDGYDYHHIVWQGGPNATNISPELLHSTENMVRVPRLLHEAITAAYSEPSEVVPSLTEREWLDTQPYEVQRAEGIRIMRKLGIIK